jgi:hypothetical protein
MKKTTVLSITFIVIMVLANLSSAYANDRSNVYINAGFSIKSIDFINSQLPNGYNNNKKIATNTLDLLVGYRFNNHFSADFQYSFMDKTLLHEDQSKNYYYYRTSLMFANLTYNLFSLSKYGFSPFVGGGLGISTPYLDHYKSEQKIDSWTTGGFIYQLRSGLNISLFDFVLLTLQYSYISIPPIKIDNTPQNNFEGNIQSFSLSISFLV